MDTPGQRRIRRPQPTNGPLRILWAFLASAIAVAGGVAFAFLSVPAEPLFCHASFNPWCGVGVFFEAIGLGFALGLAFASWVLRLGWLFFLAFFAMVCGAFAAGEHLDHPILTVVSAVLIPILAAFASIRWATPAEKSWQFWVAIGGSAGLLGVSLCLLAAG